MAQAMKLKAANGVLLEAPIYENHHRGSNWLAVIDIDPTMPGGLSRRWAKHGRGECLYMLDQVALFDAVEFGADYTTTAGNKKRDRWYGVVVAMTDGLVVVEKCSSGANAVLRSKEAKTSPSDRAAALKAEKEALIERAAKLAAEIASLEAPEPQPEPQPQAPQPTEGEKTL